MFLGQAPTSELQAQQAASRAGKGGSTLPHLPGLGLWGQLPLIRASFMQVGMVNDHRHVFT